MKPFGAGPGPVSLPPKEISIPAVSLGLPQSQESWKFPDIWNLVFGHSSLASPRSLPCLKTPSEERFLPHETSRENDRRHRQIQQFPPPRPFLPRH